MKQALRTIGVICTCCLNAVGLRAQAVRGDLLSAATTEIDMRQAQGWGVGLQLGSAEIKIQRWTSSSQRVGGTCAGLIPPGYDCTDEVLDVRSRFTAARLGWVIDSRPRRIMARFGMGVGASRFEGTREGHRTGRSLSDEVYMAGIDVQTGITYAPFTSVPIRIRVAGTSGLWFNPLAGQCEDCYDPYGALAEASLAVGLECHF